MKDKVFVSPGVYTSEKELRFVTSNVGVTTLGLVGEVTKGPAFKPIFVSNYDEFRTFFGGLNTTKIKDTGFLRYELPYVAKSYLANSNQLYVSRVLGFSGHNAGDAYVVTVGSEDAIVLRSRGSYDQVSVELTPESLGTTIAVTSATSGTLYEIVDAGDTDFTLIGAADSNVGTQFTATGAGTGTGTIAPVISAVTGLQEQFVFDVTTSVAVGGTAEAMTVTIDGGDPINVSLDKTKKNYITRVFGRSNDDGNMAVYVDEIYDNIIAAQGLSASIALSATGGAGEFNNYRRKYKGAESPYVVSEVKADGAVSRLFKFVTIGDGEAANTEVKMSIVNIKPDEREFDLIVRDFNDLDADPVILERFTKLNMDPASPNYIARRVGTANGDFVSYSKYILMEMAEGVDVSDSYPAGFEGYTVRDGLTAPGVIYKKDYGMYENKRKHYLGTSSRFDKDILKYKGLAADGSEFTAKTLGFHMDAGADAGLFDVPSDAGLTFRSENDALGSDYEKLYSRKFTVAVAGGYDGWDIYRTSRTNTAEFSFPRLNSDGMVDASETLPENSTLYRPIQLTDLDPGVTTDYYAFLEGIRTFANAEAVDINVFATPGLDTMHNPDLVEYTIEMIERERSDSLYIISLPDTIDGVVMTAEEAAEEMYGKFDSNYTATYWPWIQIPDNENNAMVYLPPTGEVLRNIALTDNTSYPWFAVAGFARGDVKANKARLKLTQAERDVLYEARINPLATFSGEGVKIFGNKNLQVKNTPLDRINVRRLLLQTRKLISAVAVRLLFDQNDETVRSEFLRQVNPILESIRKERGLTDFRVQLMDTPEDADRNSLIGKIFIKPTSALEYIELEFNVMPTGASFEDL